MATTMRVGPGGATLWRMLDEVRARWRLRLVLRGAVVVLGVSLAALIVAAYGMEQARFSASAIVWYRTGALALIALAIGACIARPFLRRPEVARVALYLEEHEPTLDAAVLSAVEQSSELAAHDRSTLAARLVERAATSVRGLDGGRRVEQRALTESWVMLAIMTAAAALLFALGPSFLRQGARLVLAPWGAAAATATYAVEVTPGSATVARGGDQQIGARLHGFESDTVALIVRRADSTVWHRIAMTRADTSGRWSARLFDLDMATDYYVESNGVRSAVFRLTVARLPYVERIDLDYRYPSYTGLPAERVEDGGDIAALRGTGVTVTAHPTMAVRGGRILIEGKPPIAMTLDSAGVLRGALTVRDPGFYRIELDAADGSRVNGSLDYTIDPIADAPPSVRIAKPGRDSKASSVDEVLVQVEGHDDFGVRSLELVYRVNGGDEQTLALDAPGGSRAKESVGTHTFFLEELHLAPGDMIAYYARATDNDAVSGFKRATSDIYFLQIRPFGQDYRQQQSGAGARGGAQSDSPSELSARQREIVAGTFRVIRDSASFAAKERGENVTTLLLSQGRLREQVQDLTRQIIGRGLVARDSTFRIIADELPKAATEMQRAEEQLAKGVVSGALPPEQRALQHLQRAEAAFRDVSVSMGGGGGGGGGGANASSAEDLADLFELQTDKLRNQYETVDRGAEQQAKDAEVDETLERLKRLAAREQQENERAQARMGATRSSGGGGGGASQRQLAEEAEQLARRLERLAREQKSPALDESARRLKEAADMMRRAAASPSASGTEQASAASRRLDDARRLLDDERNGRAARDAKDAVERAEQIARDQRAIGDELSRLGADPERARRLGERKDSLAGDVDALETQLERMARDNRRERPEGARQLQAAAAAIRDARLQDKIRFSKGLVRGGQTEYARNLERQIGTDIDSMKQRVATAAGTLSEQRPAESAARSLDRARNLVRGLESLDRRTRERQSGEGRTGQQGQGQQGQGQQGQGQQGQGQQGQGQQGGSGQGSAQGQRSAGGSPTGVGGGAPVGAPSGSGRLSAEDARQLGRAYRDERGDAEALRRELAGAGVEAGELDRAIEAMRRLESPNAYADPEGLRRLQESLLERMKAFEFALRQNLGERLGAARPLSAGSGDVPAGYRQLVDEYFRALSRRPR